MHSSTLPRVALGCALVAALALPAAASAKGVCGIGGRVGGDPDPFWDVKRNHVAAQVGGDQLKAHGGDRILWYLAPRFPVGDELVLRAPARARPGVPVEATVYAFTDKGKRRPAVGASVDF